MYCLYFILTVIIVGSPLDNHIKYGNYFWVFGIYILIYGTKLTLAIFIFIGLFIRFIHKLFRKNALLKVSLNIKPFAYTGIVFGVFVFACILYGFIITKTDFTVRHYTLKFRDLPSAFESLKIIHISDAHLGSFTDSADIVRAADLIKRENPDILFFTGDMINVSYVEALPYIDIFKKINPKYGKYSVLGNHDIGDYAKWDMLINQKELNEEILKCEKRMGFTILTDTNVKIYAGNDSLFIAGVNNCGSPPFKRRGDLNKAIIGTDSNRFIIFLTHDPAIWSGEVVNKTNIQLTLSGHTHGMQLGIISRFFKWSPIALKYNYWLGLYESNDQYLVINSGLGFLGFPGRIGIPPEITVINLKKK
jgi:predicted MPP superfamily phosphohydrolase